MTTTASPVQVSSQAVEQMIRKDIASADALSALLLQEHEQLKSRNHNDLSALIDNKQGLLSRLEQSARQRSVWIKYLTDRTRLPADECWQHLLQELGNPQVSELWQQFQVTIADCKRRNEINAKLVARGQRTLKQLLGLLRGQFIESPNLYTAAGSASAQKQSHTVFKV